MKSHKDVSLTRIKVGALGSTAECVQSNRWRMITCSFSIDEFDGTVTHVLLGYFYSFIRYWPAKNDEAQVSWDPLQLLLVVSLFLMHKVWHYFLGFSRFILTPLTYFPNSSFHFQCQAAFHSTKANNAFSFSSLHPSHTFLLHSNIFICVFLP